MLNFGERSLLDDRQQSIGAGHGARFIATVRQLLRKALTVVDREFLYDGFLLDSPQYLQLGVKMCRAKTHDLNDF